MFDQKIPIVDLTTISNSGHYSVDTNDDKDEIYQLITTDYEENNETEDSIDPEKQI